MRYVKQEETAFTPHGNWNTRHTVSISLDEALEIMTLIEKVYPNAFTYEGGKWRFGKVNYNELPNTHMQSIVKVLEEILDKKP